MRFPMLEACELVKGRIVCGVATSSSSNIKDFEIESRAFYIYIYCVINKNWKGPITASMQMIELHTVPFSKN